MVKEASQSIHEQKELQNRVSEGRAESIIETSQPLGVGLAEEIYRSTIPMKVMFKLQESIRTETMATLIILNKRTLGEPYKAHQSTHFSTIEIKRQHPFDLEKWAGKRHMAYLWIRTFQFIIESYMVIGLVWSCVCFLGWIKVGSCIAALVYWIPFLPYFLAGLAGEFQPPAIVWGLLVSIVVACVGVVSGIRYRKAMEIMSRKEFTTRFGVS